MKVWRLIRALALVGVLGALVAPAWGQQGQQQGPEQSTGGSGQNSGQEGAPASPVQPVSPLEKDSAAHTMPVPAAHSGLAAYGSLNDGNDQVEPDTHTLSGGETFGLGSLFGFRRIFDPALYFSESADTGIVSGQINSVTSFGGSLALRQDWGPYRFTAVYRGARTFYRPNSLYDQTYHDLGLSQVIEAGRWTLRVRDDLTYAPQAIFGGLDTGGLGFSSLSNLLSYIQPTLAQGQTISTGRARRLGNTILGEADYALSRRTTLTFTGSYGLLHFLDPGYIDSHEINGRLGYDYALSPKDTISFIYGYDRTVFGTNSGIIDANNAQMAFGRRVTGRLAFQVAAGPQLLSFHNFSAPLARKLSWNLSSGLTYAFRRTGYSLSYSRGLTSGSGVVYGAETNVITASMNHAFTRFWSGTVDGGYALNSSLATNASTGRYNYWFGGVNLGRQVGRHLQIDLSYEFQQQTTSNAICQVASCGSTGLRQVFGITVQWHPWMIATRE